MIERKYFIGVDCNDVRSIVCTSKDAIAKFFDISVSSVKRYLSKGVRCISPGRYLFEESITKISKANPINNIPKEYRKRANTAPKSAAKTNHIKVKDTLKEEPKIGLVEAAAIKNRKMVEDKLVPISPTPEVFNVVLYGRKNKKQYTVTMDRPRPADLSESIKYMKEAGIKRDAMEAEDLKPKAPEHDPNSVIEKLKSEF